MNIFVTGASGFIGKVFMRELLDRLGQESTVFVLSRSTVKFNDPRVLYLDGDLSSIDRYAGEITEADYVFHLAANATFGDGEEYDAVNFEATKNLVAVAKKSNRLKNFIFVSTIGAVDREPSDRCVQPITADSIPHPTSRYGQSKLKAEHFLKSSGIPYTIVRPTWVYGPDMRNRSHINVFVSMAFEHSALLRLRFPGRVSVIHVRDLAYALATLVGNDAAIGNTYIAETEAVSIGYMFNVVRIAVGGKRGRQLFVPKLGFFFGRVHRLLPLTISNLFIDYLWARDDNFGGLLAGRKPILFKDGIGDVINSNAYKDGYWLITGANSGIGHALATQLYKRGNKLILVDKEVSHLKQFFGSVIKQVDLSNREEIHALADELQTYKLFRLINNAGVGYRGNTQDISEQQVLTMVSVNIEAPLLLTKLLIKQLAAYNGTIVNIASSAAYNPLPGMSVYAASKAFVLQWSSALWYELRGVCRVITISPSGTNTNFQAAGGVKGGGGALLSADYVVEKILYAVDHKGTDFIFLGTKNRIVAFVCKFFPPAFNSRFWGTLFSKMR